MEKKTDHKVIIPTGYMATGSSAVTDLLRETIDYPDRNRDFEYVFLHCPDGLFDLEDKLLIGNNIIRSDEAIHRFLRCMQVLYRKPFYWISGYKKIIPDFLDDCKRFIKSLGVISVDDSYWYYQEYPENTIAHIKMISSSIKNRLKKQQVALPPLRYKNKLFAYPEEELFYERAKEFLNTFFIKLGLNKHDLILDQLLLPHNLFRIDRYFDKDVRVIVVDRDPRDMFIINKYFLSKKGSHVPYSYNAEKFCEMYSKQRKMEKTIEDPRILRICFEDLVYHYADTRKKIYEFAGLNHEESKNTRRFFDPQKSIVNTQLFNRYSEYKLEAGLIASRLKEYLYEFPSGETITGDIESVF